MHRSVASKEQITTKTLSLLGVARAGEARNRSGELRFRPKPVILMEMPCGRTARLVALFNVWTLLAWGGLFKHSKGSPRNHASAITLRKRLHVNPLITSPDTMEVEWGVAVSTDGSFTLPAVIHFTPEGSHVW